MGNIEEANKWVGLAERDIVIANHLNETLTPKPVEIVCFHAQQAAEKILKAILAFHDARIRKTHDIMEIIDLCREHTDDIIFDERIANLLSEFAVAPRYIVDRRDFTDDTAAFAIKQAENIMEQVRQYLQKQQ